MKNPPVVLVTGASRGLGLEIVKQLAARGAQVILAARRAPAGEAAIAGLTPPHPITVLELDVTNPASIGAACASIEQRHGRLDVLINNAGINLDGSASGRTVTAAILQQTFATNSIAPLQLAQALLPLLKRSAAARIVNVTSSLAATGNPLALYPAYRMSKAALNAATILLSTELSADGIAVNAVCPGWTRTDLGGPQAPKSVQEGADSPVWLALDAPHDLRGKFVSDRQVTPW